MKRLLIIVIVLLVILLTSACAAPSKGERGSDGLNGAIGSNGQDGADGQDAEPTTVVKLCPGVTAYPGVFVEIAICLQGRLYGVYSTHGGFLTELVPGTYSSNAIGSACNLTVQANCIVVN